MSWSVHRLLLVQNDFVYNVLPTYRRPSIIWLDQQRDATTSVVGVFIIATVVVAAPPQVEPSAKNLCSSDNRLTSIIQRNFVETPYAQDVGACVCNEIPNV